MFPLRDYFYTQYLTALNALFRYIFPITNNNNALTDGHHALCFPHPSPPADPTDTSSLITFDNGNGSVLPPPPPHGPSPSDPEAVIQPSPLKELPDNALLEVGSMVEVDVEHAELYGVIRWIGPLHIPGTISSSNTRVMVGIELEEEPMEGSVEITDGVYDNVR